MSERLSTALINFLGSRGSLRAFLQDVQMKIYTGAAPSDADDAVTGTRLVTVTQASGTSYNRCGWGEIVDVLVTSHAAAETWGFDVTIGSETLIATGTYTNTPDAGAVADVAVRLCRLFNDIGCFACATGTDGHVYVMAPSRKALLIALTAGKTGTVTITDAIYAADSNGDLLNFGPASSGTLSKTSDTWSGLIAATGVAGYFRLVRPDDDGTESTTQLRAQGVCGTSGAELNMGSTTLTAGLTHTVSNYSFTVPAE